MNIKDQFILAQLRKGDLIVFEKLFKQYHQRLCSYSFSLLKNDELAEEVVQDIFYNIWKNRTELKIANIRAYLYRSAYNNSMMIIRKRKKEVYLDTEWAEAQRNTDPDPSESMDGQEINERILKALEKMPERTREIFTLNRYEGLKYKDIALKLAISIKTVEANMGRALKTLRTCLQDYGT